MAGIQEQGLGPAHSVPPHPYADGLQRDRDLASIVGGKPKARQSSPIMRFSTFPKWLRVGPWTWAARVYITSICVLVIVMAPSAFGGMPLPSALSSVVFQSASLSKPQRWDNSVCVSCLAFSWQASIIAYMLKYTGAWPLVTFTMLSWIIAMARFALIVLGRFSPAAVVVAELLRGPALINAVIVFAFWWFMLAPITLAVLPGKQRAGFLKFNVSFFLLNVHVANLPLGLLSHWVERRALGTLDLWTSMAFGVLYLLFYLLVLDPRGIHLYIILSPRTSLCVVSYTLVMGAYLAVYNAFAADESVALAA